MNSNLFGYSRKVEVSLYVTCAKLISVLNMGEKMIVIDTRAFQSIKYMWMLPNHKEN